MDNYTLRKLAGLPVSEKFQARPAVGLQPFDIEQVKRRAGILTESTCKMLVKLDASTEKALKDISTYRTIKVIPKKNGTVATVSGMAGDMDEVKKRWPILAKSLVESAEEETEIPDEEVPAEEKEEEIPAIITKIAAKAEGKTSKELVGLIQNVYDAGFKDGVASTKEEEKVEEAAPPPMVPSISVKKEDDAGWLAVEIAKAGIPVDMEEAMGTFYFNFKTPAISEKASAIAKKLEIELA